MELSKKERNNLCVAVGLDPEAVMICELNGDSEFRKHYVILSEDDRGFSSIKRVVTLNIKNDPLIESII